jgi:hypothetical protein
MSRNEEEIQVQCYSGHTYAERPDSFVFQSTAHKVEKVEKEWREPGERHFQVRTQDNKLFELCYNEQKDEWALVELD